MNDVVRAVVVAAMDAVAFMDAMVDAKAAMEAVIGLDAAMDVAELAIEAMVQPWHWKRWVLRPQSKL